MSTEDNKALMHRWMEAFKQRTLAVYDELCAPEFMLHSASTTMQGVEPYKQNLSLFLTAFPDLQFSIEDMIAEGDRVVNRHTNRGTHTGEFFGIPPTGKQVSGTGIVITRFANGKGVEAWANYDDLGLLQQLGVVPSLG